MKSAQWLVLVVTGWLLAGCTSPLLPRSRAETVESRVRALEKTMAPLWRERLAKADANYPPDRVLLTFFKDERRLRLYVPQSDGRFVEVASWKVLAASGSPGPKLRQGDEQVPEGVYPIWSLNPNSRFHLSLHVGYPNERDRAQAARDKRTRLGGDIMIHGSMVSIGCIAIGDAAIEEVFYLAAIGNFRRWKLVSAATDLRRRHAETVTGPVVKKYPWMAAIYTDAEAELQSIAKP